MPSRGTFTSVTVGQPGSVGDGATFNRSKLKRKLERGELLPRHGFTRRFRYQAGRRRVRVSVRPFIVADAAFALAPYMMKSFDDAPRYTLENSYTYCHIRTRRVVENAFGRLKGRFRVLKQAKLNNPMWLMRITKVCCALHNMCERYNSPYEDTLAGHLLLACTMSLEQTL